MSTLKEDLRRFPWGTITQKHVLGQYTLIEYVQEGVSNSKENGQTFFSGYIDGKSVHESWGSLEAGIIGLIVRAKLGMNQSAAVAHICRGIGIE